MTERAGFDWFGHGCIALTLFFTIYGQLVLKWQMSMVGPLPPASFDKMIFLAKQLLNPWILSGYISALTASLAWMAAMTRFELGYAYPFMSLAFILVMLVGIVALGEPFSVSKLIGTLLVLSGLITIARS